MFEHLRGQDTEALWIEFKSLVWTGMEHNYVESICLQPRGDHRPDRPCCALFSRDDDNWGFVMRDGTIVIVPNANIRFVVFGRSQEIPSNSDPHHESVVTGETTENAAQGEDNVHSVDITAEQISAPVIKKRRGRPPKNLSPGA